MINCCQFCFNFAFKSHLRRYILAYADGGLSLWDMHGRRPVAVTPAEVGRGLGHGGGVGELRTACWVGGGGAVAASGHDVGRCRLTI